MYIAYDIPIPKIHDVIEDSTTYHDDGNLIICGLGMVPKTKIFEPLSRLSDAAGKASVQFSVAHIDIKEYI